MILHLMENQIKAILEGMYFKLERGPANTHRETTLAHSRLTGSTLPDDLNASISKKYKSRHVLTGGHHYCNTEGHHDLKRQKAPESWTAAAG